MAAWQELCIGVALAGGAYALALARYVRRYRHPVNRREARLARAVKVLGWPVLALRSIMRRQPAVRVEVHPRTRTVDHRASAEPWRERVL